MPNFFYVEIFLYFHIPVLYTNLQVNASAAACTLQMPSNVNAEQMALCRPMLFLAPVQICFKARRAETDLFY